MDAPHPMIITAAITGGGNTPSMTPYLPVRPEEIARSAIEAAAAGAAIVHIHARHPETGRPSNAAEHFAPILAAIKEQSDVVISITAPGMPEVPVAERMRNIELFEPEMAAFVVGSSNYSFYDRLGYIREYKHAWEKPFLEASRDFIYKNSFADCEYICELMRQHQVRPELEIFGLAHLYNLAELVQRGFLEPPLHVEFVMGMLGAVGAHAEDLIFLKNKAERLLGTDNVTWSVSGMVGRGNFKLMPLAIELGGHIRVGIEDNVVLRGALAPSNAAVVEHYINLAQSMGRQIATAEDARRILRLKGTQLTAF